MNCDRCKQQACDFIHTSLRVYWICEKCKNALKSFMEDKKNDL